MLIKSTNKKGTFTCDKDGKKLIELIDSLWWGRDRWDSSTEKVMNEIADLLGDEAFKILDGEEE